MRITVRGAARLWGHLRGNAPAMFGLLLVAVLASAALLAPLLPLADPYATALDRRFLPAFHGNHLLGTDQLGRDLLSRLVWGTRSSLGVGLSATLAAALVGTLVGMLAGYLGRWVDTLLMRVVDVLMAFPYLLLALAIVAALGPGLRNAMIAIVVVNVPFFARTVRGAVLALKDRPFVEAARMLGFSAPRILAFEVLPNVMPAIVIMVGTTLGWMVLETAGLSFLGLGAQPPSADLGSMLGESREFLTTMPRVALLPGLVILLLVIGINLVGDGIRDALDPHQPAGAGQAPDPSPQQAPDEAAPAPLLRVQELGIAFSSARRSPRVVAELGFELAAGERLALVGESGSGKTQSALALLGLIPPPGRIAAGSIRLRGEEFAGAGQGRWRQVRGKVIAYVPQDPMTALDPLFTVGEQLIETLGLGSHLARPRLRSEAAELLERVRLPEPRKILAAYPHELSGGMRQRVMIALGIAHGPEVLITDEATTALDVTIQAEILELLDSLCAERRMSLIFITHDLALVGQICERVLVLYAGRPVEVLDVHRLYAGAAHPYTRALLACTPVLGHPEKSLQPIPGVPPAVDALPPGCHFAPRCPFAELACRTEPGALRALRPGQLVRCRRAAELMP